MCLLLNYLIETNCFTFSLKSIIFSKCPERLRKTAIDYNYHELVMRWVSVFHFLLVCHLVKTNQSKKQFGYWFTSPCQLKLHVSRRIKIIVHVHRKHFLLTYKK